MEEQFEPTDRQRLMLFHIAKAFGIGLAFALGTYLLIEAASWDSGLVSLTFLAILPACISAFIAWAGDPHKERSRSYYMLVPLILLGTVIVASLVFLQEGAVCVVMLSPIWLASSYFGIWLLRRTRPSEERFDANIFRSSLLVVPLIAMQIEPMIPLPQETATVTRSIIVEADADAIWPQLEGMQDIQDGEGRWNLTQDLIGVPRPVGASLDAEGIGAARHADWGYIRFAERIIEWDKGHKIGWDFDFSDSSGWEFTDRHLVPGNGYYDVVDGGYTLKDMGDGRTEVTLHTRYWMQTPVNLYARAWGELFLGDISNNLLTTIKQRSEAIQAAR